MQYYNAKILLFLSSQPINDRQNDRDVNNSSNKHCYIALAETYPCIFEVLFCNSEVNDDQEIFENI